MGNWANDIFRGYTQGEYLSESISRKADARKAEKAANAIQSEAIGKLFQVEDKGTLGNWAYNTFGFGDPPKLTPNPGHPAAAGPTPQDRLRDGAKLANAMGGGDGTAPAQMPVSADYAYQPQASPQFAPAAPLVAVALPAEGPAPTMSPRRKAILEGGTNV